MRGSGAAPASTQRAQPVQGQERPRPAAPARALGRAVAAVVLLDRTEAVVGVGLGSAGAGAARGGQRVGTRGLLIAGALPGRARGVVQARVDALGLAAAGAGVAG